MDYSIDYTIDHFILLYPQLLLDKGTMLIAVPKSFAQTLYQGTARLGLTAKAIENGGKSLKDHLLRLDLTGCYYTDNGCMLCESGEHGGSHTRSGAHYSGICVICEEQGKLARYDGETGRNGYYRSTLGHKKDIVKENTENAPSI